MSLYCKRCKQYISLEAPNIIKLSGDRFILMGVCGKCIKLVRKTLNKKQIKMVPKSIKESNDYSEQTGGVIPLLSLIPLILGGIGAVSGVASAVANPIIQNKKIEEEKRHNLAVENIAIGGSGLNESTSSRTLTEIINDLNKVTDEEKRQLIGIFSGLGYMFW